MTKFACNSVTRWQETQGRHDHSQAAQLLMLCDGSNSAYLLEAATPVTLR